MRHIVLDTARSLYQHAHKIAAHCDSCNRWHEFSLESLECMGVAGRPLMSLQFRCGECGSVGQVQIRPPVPNVGGAVQYI